MNYRHYYTTPKLDNDQSYYGNISDLPEVGIIHGSTIDDFEEHFHQAVDEYLRAQEAKKAKRGRRGLIWGLGILALLVVMAVTCPDKDKHVKSVTDSLSVILNDQASGQEDDWEMLGAMLGNKVIGAVIQNNLYVDNYILFNIGRLSYDGEEKIVSVGAFNHVFTASRETVRKRASEDEDLNKLLDDIF